MLENQLSHLLSILTRVECGFSHKDLALSNILNAHFLLKSVLPQLSKVIPIVNFAVCDWIFDI